MQLFACPNRRQQMRVFHYLPAGVGKQESEWLWAHQGSLPHSAMPFDYRGLSRKADEDGRDGFRFARAIRPRRRKRPPRFPSEFVYGNRMQIAAYYHCQLE
jgi:hypothetical protein